MGRIEYEYPLFKVYYSNNSNNSNIRGNPVLSELSNLSFGTFCDTRLVAGASDGASVRVHWPLLVSRGVWWTRGVEENGENGDRIVILPDLSYVELKTFVTDIFCFDAAFGFEMKFWKYNFNMSADCRNFLEMVLTNAVMEGETERHANAGEEFQNRYCFWFYHIW